MLEKSQLITSFGGDGTILSTAQLVGDKKIPIMGVNAGGLGFLTASGPKQAVKHLDLFFDNKLSVEERSVLKMEVSGYSETKYFLNDFVADKAGFSRLINITTFVDEKFLNEYVADGLIVSTPTGSTAYSLANGGPIVVPLTNSFIINPICPHTLSNRPIVIPDKTTISLRVKSELGEFNIFGDGTKIGTFSHDKKVTLSKADFAIQLVQTPEHEFYTILREKLGWGETIRRSNRADQ
jgi:NAD+ kinase